jgi:N-acetylneuraminic acid mutarotase
MRQIFFILFFLFLQLTGSSQINWIKQQDFPGLGKSGVSSFAINGKGYMGLGLDSVSSGRTGWYEYNPASNTWTAKASLPGAGRWSCVSFVINGKGYIITGLSNSGNTNQTWEYDPILDTWTAKANFPGSPRQDAAGFSIANKGYVGTGYAGGNTFSDFYEFDPVANSWTMKAPFPGGTRSTATGFTIGAKGYIGMGAGTNSTTNYNDLYAYDPSADTWTQRASYPLPAIDAVTTVSSQTDAFVMCGYYYQYQDIEHNPMNLVYKYNAASDTWRLLGTFPGLPRGYAGGFGLANDIYLACGGNNNYTISTSTQISDLWKLTNGLSLRVGSIVTPEISIAPNPAVSYIRFGAGESNERYTQVRIYDVGGRLIKSLRLINNEQQVDVRELSTGLYFVELINIRDEVMDGSFIKE